MTSIFEWYVVWDSSKNRNVKAVYLIEIGLHAQIVITILGLIANIIGHLMSNMCPFNEHKNLHFKNE